MTKTNTHEDFLSRLKLEGDCLVYTGAKNNSGYGIFGINKAYWLTHRYAYTNYVGDIPESLLVLHSCDNRSCVLPSHLRVGTQADNMIDMKERGGRRVDASCLNGHQRNEETTYHTPQGKRYCRVCSKAAKKRQREKLNNITK